MSTIDDTYPIDIVERCLKWIQQDEGKIFWRWMRAECERLSDGKARFYGAHEMEKIIEANKMLAREEEATFINDFAKMLKILIHEKKRQGQDLITLEEIQ